MKGRDIRLYTYSGYGSLRKVGWRNGHKFKTLDDVKYYIARSLKRSPPRHRGQYVIIEYFKTEESKIIEVI